MTFSSGEKRIFNRLKNRKLRGDVPFFVAEGEKICREIWNIRRDLVHGVFISSRRKDLESFFHEAPVKWLEEKTFREITQTIHSQGVLMLCRKESFVLPEKISGKCSFYLVNIQDPGNVGTILRICAWFGISDIFCSRFTVPWYHPKVIQSSAGAFLYTRMHETDIDEVLEKKWFSEVLRADLEGSLPQSGSGNTLILLGNEGSGFPDEIRNKVPLTVSIPALHHKPKPESLNVAVTCGILAYAFHI